jgi:hypothetical protein
MPTTQRSTALDLDISEGNGSYALTFANAPVLTPGGHTVVHGSPDLLQHMIGEFDLEGSIVVRAGVIEKPKVLSSYALYCIQKDFVEVNKDELHTQFTKELYRDGILFRSAGPEVVEQLARWSPALAYLETLGLTLPALPGPFMGDYELSEDDGLACGGEEDGRLSRGFVETLSHRYRALTAPQRTVAMFLHAIHGGVVLFPMVLAEGKCTPNEYAGGVLASHAMITGVFGDVKKGAHRKAFENCRSDARIALDYLAFHDNELEAIRRSIQGGETITREFKSTLRWNIKAERDDDAMTHACLKTIAAFLNSDGGELFIGVADDGSIVGIEADHFPDGDKYQLHLMNVVKQSIGDATATFVSPKIVAIDGKEICHVVCRKPPAASPIFLRFKKGDEEFFVRTGPSTTKLTPSETLHFMTSRQAKGK